MLFYFTILSPLISLFLRYSNATPSQIIILGIALYILTHLLRKLDEIHFFKYYAVFLLQSRFVQNLIYHSLQLEEFLLTNRFLGLFLFFCVNYFAIYYVFAHPVPLSLVYWSFACLYWFFVGYVRMRLTVLNDIALNLYGGRSYFYWHDVVREISTYVDAPINNKVANRGSQSFSGIVPKRPMHKTAGKIFEIPEVQRVAVTTTMAVGAAGIAAVSGIGEEALKSVQEAAASPEKQAVLQAEKNLRQSTTEKCETLKTLSEIPEKPLHPEALELRKEQEGVLTLKIRQEEVDRSVLKKNIEELEQSIQSNSSTATLLSQIESGPFDSYF